MIPPGAAPPQGTQPFFQPTGGNAPQAPIDPNPLADILGKMDVYDAYVRSMAAVTGPDSDWAKELQRLDAAKATRKAQAGQ
jgi:hypothetical protein